MAERNMQRHESSSSILAQLSVPARKRFVHRLTSLRLGLILAVIALLFAPLVFEIAHDSQSNSPKVQQAIRLTASRAHLLKPLADSKRFGTAVTVPSSSTTTSSTTTTTTIASVSTSVLSSVSCLGPNLCVAVGDDGSGDALIETSSNGTDSFSSVIAPLGSPALSAVSCGGASTCVAVGGSSIIYSSDDGASWDSSSSTFSTVELLGVSCSSDSDCLAVGMTPGPGIADIGAILYSDDGGEDWSESQTPASAPAISSVSCQPSGACIAVGGTVLVSSDDGKTWSNEPVSGGIQALSSVECSGNTCVAIGPNAAGDSHVGAAGEEVTSSDGGQTWVAGSLPQGTATAWSLSCSSNLCMFVGPPVSTNGAPLSETSSNGGVDWSPTPGTSGLSSFRDIDCVSLSECVAVGQGSSGAAVSVYSGSSWSPSEVTS
jgi:photosystem II stability/assembly factor-like uncharacterized protein